MISPRPVCPRFRRIERQSPNGPPRWMKAGQERPPRWISRPFPRLARARPRWASALCRGPRVVKSTGTESSVQDPLAAAHGAEGPEEGRHLRLSIDARTQRALDPVFMARKLGVNID